MYKWLLNFLGYEEYKILDMEKVHKFGTVFKGCSIYTGSKENWESTKELAYRRGIYNMDHSTKVETGTPTLTVVSEGEVVIDTDMYFKATRKVKKEIK